MDGWVNCWLDTHVPSELFELVLPSVDSLLPCRVTRFLISTAMPVSVLRRMVLRSFFVPPSEENIGPSSHFNPLSLIIRGSLSDKVRYYTGPTPAKISLLREHSVVCKYSMK